MHNAESVLENETSLGFWDTNESPNLSWTTGTSNNQQKMRTRRIGDLAFPADHKIKLRESVKERQEPRPCPGIEKKL